MEFSIIFFKEYAFMYSYQSYFRPWKMSKKVMKFSIFFLKNMHSDQSYFRPWNKSRRGEGWFWLGILCRTIWWSTGAWWTGWDLTTWATRLSSPTCLRDPFRMVSALTPLPRMWDWWSTELMFFINNWRDLFRGESKSVDKTSSFIQLKSNLNLSFNFLHLTLLVQDVSCKSW